MRFADYASSWIEQASLRRKPATIKRRRAALAALAEHFRGELAEVGAEQIATWRLARGRQVEPRTFNIEAALLKSVLTAAARDGLARADLAERVLPVGVRRAEITVPSDPEYAELVRWLYQHEPDRAELVEFLALSGCRVSEARYLTWFDVDTGGGTLIVRGHPEHGTKNGSVRRVPLFKPLAALLARLQDGRPIPFKCGDARRALQRGCRATRQREWTHHTFRHLFATRAIQLGIDPPTIALWLGHQDRGVLIMRTYTHIMSEHSRRMAERMSNACETVGGFSQCRGDTLQLETASSPR